MQNKKSIKRENSKKEKSIVKAHSGITLIALVITIIVLLILAGVALSALTGDSGILSNSEKAKEDTLEANAKEKVQIAIMEHKIGQYAEGKTLKEYLEAAGATGVNEEGTEGVMDGYNFKIENGVVTVTKEGTETPPPQTSNLTEAEKTALTTNGIAELTTQEIAALPNAANLTNNPNVKAVLTGGVVIPTQFTYVEGTKETGVVVSVTGNNNVISEFVWVPVEVPVASAEAEGTTNKAMAINLGTVAAPQYRGLLYNFTSTTTDGVKTVTSSVISGTTTTTSSYREPSLVTGSSGTIYDGASDNYDTLLGYDSAEQFGEKMQEDYNLMIESVKKYGGFYIGRYETSVNGETVASTRGTDATRPMASVKWYELYKKQKAYSSDNSLNSVQSSMVWGSQYDAMLNWAIKGADAVKATQNTNASHSLSETYQPGKQTVTGKTDKINNIYDLEGNVREWTLEANYTYLRVLRGGYYSYAVSPCPRDYYNYNPTVSFPYCGSRPTLYIL